VPLDATAVGRTLAQGAAKANAQAKAAGEHEHKATEIWTRTASGMGHQGATDLLHLPPNDFTSTPLSDIPGALKMQAGDLGGAVADIGKAEGALATTGAVFGALTAAEQLVSVPLSAIPFPAFPAVRIMDTDVGLPHAHAHPPNLVPPAPPVPLPSAGPVIPIPYASGAETVLINEMPAARCGDLGMGIWCGGYVPMFEIFLGSSSVWIEGARAARIGIDITKHCIFSDKAVGPMIGTTVSASPNVIIGGIPMPSLSAMAIGAALKLAFKGIGKLIKALRRGGKEFSRFDLMAKDRPRPVRITAEHNLPQDLRGSLRRADGRISGRRFAGEYRAAEIARLRAKGIEVVENADKLMDRYNLRGAAAAFDSQEKQILLRRGASRYEYFHEMQHAEHLLEVGPDEYQRLGRHAKEQRVFDKIHDNSEMFNQREYEHARRYMDRLDEAKRNGKIT
jgi:uncharacterized Zn-binding protein involved in type VI secretion